MTRLLASVATVFFLLAQAENTSLSTVNAAPPDEPKYETRKFEGVWKPQSAVLGGTTLPTSAVNAITLTISSAEYEVHIDGEKKSDKGAFSFDADARPKRMTIKSTSGPNRGKTFLAIYEMQDAETMRVCYDLAGKEFPKDFTAPKGTQFYLVDYRRQQHGTSTLAIKVPKKVDAVYLSTQVSRWALQIGVLPYVPHDAEMPPIPSTQVWLLKSDGTVIPYSNKPKTVGLSNAGQTKYSIYYRFPAAARTDAMAIVVNIDDEIFVERLPVAVARRGRLTDAKAIEIASRALSEKFPGAFEKYKPYRARLTDGMWHVWGTFPDDAPGGPPEAHVRDADGVVTKIFHLQ